MELPGFKYHPDPLATGNVIESDEPCECCGENRGYLYKATIYAEDEIANICPWCIASGDAASRFDAMFSDDYPLLEAGLPEQIVDEVVRRTPGYNSWQQEEWQVHCEDACEFHGYASKQELASLKDARLSEFLAVQMIDHDSWKSLVQVYQAGGNPAIYKFVCRHCDKIIYTMDHT